MLKDICSYLLEHMSFSFITKYKNSTPRAGLVSTRYMCGRVASTTTEERHDIHLSSPGNLLVLGNCLRNATEVTRGCATSGSRDSFRSVGATPLGTSTRIHWYPGGVGTADRHVPFSCYSTGTETAPKQHPAAALTDR